MNEHLAPYERNYITEVCRCDEIERKLRYIEHEILKDNIIIWNPTEIPKSLHPSDTALFEVSTSFASNLNTLLLFSL